MLLPAGSIGPRSPSTSRTPIRSCARSISDLRFRQAISHAINREEMNQVLYFGLGKLSQALPADTSFATDADANYMIDYDVDKGQRAARRDGHEAGADGMRTYPDGSPFTILWEYSIQFATAEFVKLMTRLPEGGRAQA